MNTPNLSDRLAAMEDEIAGIESMVDSRTRKLWSEIQILREEVKEIRTRSDAGMQSINKTF